LTEQIIFHNFIFTLHFYGFRLPANVASALCQNALCFFLSLNLKFLSKLFIYSMHAESMLPCHRIDIVRSSRPVQWRAGNDKEISVPASQIKLLDLQTFNLSVLF